MIHSNLSDSNKHVPVLSPDDRWDEAEASTPETRAATTVLPPRRTAADRSPDESAASAESAQTGLRIEPNLARLEVADSPPRFEVQEIDGTVIRLDPEAPAAAKIARHVAFHEKPEPDPDAASPGEGRDWGLAHRHSLRWLLGAAALVMALVIVAMTLLPKINAKNALRPRQQKETFTAETDGAGSPAMALPLAKQPEAMQIFRAYAQAVHVDELIPLVRDGRALKETLRGNWHPLGISKQWTPPADTGWAASVAAGHPCGILKGRFPDRSKFTAYFTNDGDHLLLDWKATVGFGTASFAQLAKNEGDPGEIRGEISRAEFYSATWPEADYRSYRLVSPDGETVIWCYTRLGSATEETITALFKKTAILKEAHHSRKITVRLERGPAGSLPNQWLVGGLLHIDWIAP